MVMGPLKNLQLPGPCNLVLLQSHPYLVTAFLTPTPCAFLAIVKIWVLCFGFWLAISIACVYNTVWLPIAFKEGVSVAFSMPLNSSNCSRKVGVNGFWRRGAACCGSLLRGRHN